MDISVQMTADVSGLSGNTSPLTKTRKDALSFCETINRIVNANISQSTEDSQSTIGENQLGSKAIINLSSFPANSSKEAVESNGLKKSSSFPLFYSKNLDAGDTEYRYGDAFRILNKVKPVKLELDCSELGTEASDNRSTHEVEPTQYLVDYIDLNPLIMIKTHDDTVMEHRDMSQAPQNTAVLEKKQNEQELSLTKPGNIIESILSEINPDTMQTDNYQHLLRKASIKDGIKLLAPQETSITGSREFMIMDDEDEILALSPENEGKGTPSFISTRLFKLTPAVQEQLKLLQGQQEKIHHTLSIHLIMDEFTAKSRIKQQGIINNYVDKQHAEEDQDVQPNSVLTQKIPGTFSKDGGLSNLQNETSIMSPASLKQDHNKLMQESSNLIGTPTPATKEASLHSIQLISKGETDVPRTLVHELSDKAITMIRMNQSQMELQVKPESLGKIMLKLVMEDGGLSARITADNPVVKDIILSNQIDLRNALKDQGINILHLDVNLSNYHQENSQSQAQHAPARRFILSRAKNAVMEIEDLSNSNPPYTQKSLADFDCLA